MTHKTTITTGNLKDPDKYLTFTNNTNEHYEINHNNKSNEDYDNYGNNEKNKKDKNNKINKKDKNNDKQKNDDNSEDSDINICLKLSDMVAHTVSWCNRQLLCVACIRYHLNTRNCI